MPLALVRGLAMRRSTRHPGVANGATLVSVTDMVNGEREETSSLAGTTFANICEV